jgi:hypothetical protein
MVSGVHGNLGRHAVNPVELDPKEEQGFATTRLLQMEADNALVQTRIHLHATHNAVVSIFPMIKLSIEFFVSSC